jgi:hypothetical protein
MNKCGLTYLYLKEKALSFAAQIGADDFKVRMDGSQMF